MSVESAPSLVVASQPPPPSLMQDASPPAAEAAPTAPPAPTQPRAAPRFRGALPALVLRAVAPLRRVAPAVQPQPRTRQEATEDVALPQAPGAAETVELEHEIARASAEPRAVRPNAVELETGRPASKPVPADAVPAGAAAMEAVPASAVPAEAALPNRKTGAPKARRQAPARVARVLRRLVGVRPGAEASGGLAAQQAETSAPEPPLGPVQGDALAYVAGPTHAADSADENFENEDFASGNLESEDFGGEGALSQLADVGTPRTSGAVARTLLRRLVRWHDDPRLGRAAVPPRRSASEPAAAPPPSAEIERPRATEALSPGIDALAEPVAAPRALLPLDLTTREHAHAEAVEHPTVPGRERSTERRVLRRAVPPQTNSQRATPPSVLRARRAGVSSNATEPSAAGHAARAPEASVASVTVASAGEPLVVLRDISTTDIEAEDASAGADQSGDAAEEPDLDQLAKQVYSRLRGRLVVDRERAGRASRWA